MLASGVLDGMLHLVQHTAGPSNQRANHTVADLTCASIVCITYLYKCVDGVLRIVRVDQAVRVEAASCPLDPLILSTVTQFRPILLHDSVLIFAKVAIWCGRG